MSNNFIFNLQLFAGSRPDNYKYGRIYYYSNIKSNSGATSSWSYGQPQNGIQEVDTNLTYKGINIYPITVYARWYESSTGYQWSFDTKATYGFKKPDSLSGNSYQPYITQGSVLHCYSKSYSYGEYIALSINYSNGLYYTNAINDNRRNCNTYEEVFEYAKNLNYNTYIGKLLEADLINTWKWGDSWFNGRTVGQQLIFEIKTLMGNKTEQTTSFTSVNINPGTTYYIKVKYNYNIETNQSANWNVVNYVCYYIIILVFISLFLTSLYLHYTIFIIKLSVPFGTDHI